MVVALALETVPLGAADLVALLLERDLPLPLLLFPLEEALPPLASWLCLAFLLVLGILTGAVVGVPVVEAVVGVGIADELTPNESRAAEDIAKLCCNEKKG